MAESAHPESELTIRLSNLPDLDSLEAVHEYGYRLYGRFAILEDGNFWFAEALSSHPLDTATGWYWAITSKGELLVSARGAETDEQSLFAERKPVLGLLVEKLIEAGIIRKPSKFAFES